MCLQCPCLPLPIISKPGRGGIPDARYLMSMRLSYIGFPTRHPVSSIKYLASSIWHPVSRFQCYLSSIMIHKILADKPTKLFIFLSAFFVANALIAECIGTKLFSLEAALGLAAHPFTLLGQEGLTYTLTCGVILWPLEFVIIDVVNENY